MGGMIAQLVAIQAPERVRSLTSIMSTTGDPAVGAPAEVALPVLLRPARRRPRGRDPAGARHLPGHRLPRASSSTRRRCASAPGSPSTAPTTRPGSRASSPPSSPPTTAPPDLAKVAVPTLVVHGPQDTLVDVSGGRATAAAIPGAELLVVDGMGHDLPREMWPEILDRITALIARAG